MSWGIATIVLIIYTFLTFRNFRLAVFVFLASFPTYLLRLNIFGFPTTLLELLLIILIVFWLFHPVYGPKNLFLKNGDEKKSLKIWLITFSALLVIGILETFIAPDKLAAIGIFKAYLFEPIIFFFILLSTLKWFDDAEVALMFLGFSGLIVAGFALFQHWTGLALPIPWDLERRATSFFSYPNAVGLYLGPIIILGSGALWRSLNAEFYLRAWFWIITVGTAIVAIVFSKTEAAWLAIPLSIICLGLFLRRWQKFAAIVLMGFVVFIFLVPSARNKILLQDYSGGTRLKQWEESVNMLKDNWLFGAGLSSYPAALEPYHTHEEIEIFQYPHNIILNIWSELGIGGLIILLWLIILSGKNFLLAQKKGSCFNWLAVATAAALLEMVIHGLVDVPFFKNDLALLTTTTLAFLFWSAIGPYAYKND